MISDKQRGNIKSLLEGFVDNIELKILLEEFIFNIMMHEFPYIPNFINKVSGLVKSFENVDLNEVSWDNLCNNINSPNLGEYQERVIVQFYLYMLQNDVWQDEYKDYLKDNQWIFTELTGTWIKDRFYVNSIPYNFKRVQGQRGNEVVDLRCNNTLIRELLEQYLIYECSKNKFNYRFKVFLRYFEENLSLLGDIPNKVEDFTDKIFKKQYRFYKKISWGDNHKATRYLKGFYMFLIDVILKNYPSHNIFSNDCGIDRYYLENDKFDIYYDNGYKVVYYNRFDSISELNRWAVAPNGEEKKTIAKNSTQYIFLDFLRVKNTMLREALKRWFIHSSNNINTKQKMISCIFRFFEFIESDEYDDYVNEDLISISHWTYNHKKYSVNNIDKDVLINVEMIIAYRLYLNNYYDNSPTINNNLSSLKNFLEYIYNEKICNVEYEVFDCLRLGDKGTFKGKPLLKEDCDMIVNKFKEAIRQDDKVVQLLWIIFNICLTTNLRISEVIGLQRDCVIETMKKGQHAVRIKEEVNNEDNKTVIKLKRKNSNGKFVEYNPTPYLLRQIDIAKNLTDELVSQADKKISDFIFLKKSKTGNITTIKKDYFYRKFKSLISDLPLVGGPYTVYNLRDTFMTGIYTKAINEGIDLFYAHAATGHKQITTTIRHYINYDIRYYLEATYKIKIGDVDIKGKIVPELKDAIQDIPENINNIVVKNGCGYCKNGTCFVDCLLCSSIIVTLDRIPYFEKEIKNIDNLIMNETIQHEKEHLVVIKKLLVGYLERLLTLKVQVEGGENEGYSK